MKLTARNKAIASLIHRIDDGEIVPIDLAGVRLITPRHPIPESDRVCIVCGCDLIGDQKELCSGHWDHLRIEGIDPDQPFTDFLLALRDWLAERANDLRVTTQRLHWPAVNYLRCEVCRRPTSLVEMLCNGAGEELKRHYVCESHLSFRKG